MAFMDFFRKKNSGEIAKDRLKLLLISDRANCSPEIMEAIKNDIIKVITKYMEIAEEKFDNGADRKEWVLAMVKASAETINYNIDMRKIGEFQFFFFVCRMIQMFNDFAGITYCHDIIRNIFCYYASCAYNNIITDFYTGQYNAASANPDIISD